MPRAELQVAREPVGGRARVGAEDAAVGQPRRELPEHALRVDRVGRRRWRARSISLPPLLDLVDRSSPARRGPSCARSSGSSACSVSRASPTRLDVHRVADPDARARRGRSARRAPAPPRAGTPSRGSSSRPSAACRSPFISSQLGLRPEQADRAGDEGEVVGDAPPCRAAPSRRRRRAARRPRSPRRSAPSAPCADQDRDPLARVEDLGRACEVARRRARRAAAR